MKKVLIVLTIMVSFMSVEAQRNEQKIIIDVTSTDNKVYQSVILTLTIMTKSHPQTKFEVVAYGEAVPMLVKNKTVIAKDIAQYKDNKNVKFIACEVSMSIFNIKNEELVEGVDTVENAVADIVDKQSLGWGYIKSGN